MIAEAVVAVILAVVAWSLHGRYREAREEELRATRLERDAARRIAEQRGEQIAMLQLRAEGARRDVAETTRRSEFDVNATILFPAALERFSIGGFSQRAQAIADAAHEVLAVTSAEILAVLGGSIVSLARAPRDAATAVPGGGAPGDLFELAEPSRAGDLPPEARVTLAALDDADLVLPLRPGGRTLAIALVRGAGASPLPPAALHTLATALGAAGGLALGYADAAEKLLADNAALDRRARDAAWAARVSEERLVRTGQLARFGEFAASIAHDLKTPLGFLRGELELLDERSRNAPPSPPDLEAAITKLLEHCARMRLEIDKAMRFVRPGGTAMAEVDLEALLRETADLLSPRAAASNVRIEVEASGDSRVSANLDNLRPVIANLVVNAIEAMPGGGSIRLSVGREERHVRVGVRDTGPGVAPAVRAKLFEPFVSTKGDQGTGLGLASCRRIVEDEHGGTIGLEEPSGRGAEFFLRLPL